jgi:hypothetical protein
MGFDVMSLRLLAARGERLPEAHVSVGAEGHDGRRRVGRHAVNAELEANTMIGAEPTGAQIP